MAEETNYTISELNSENVPMLFILWLSFIGWFLLAAFIGMFTFKLSFIFISPYYNTTVSHFYLNLIKKQDVGEAKVSILRENI